MIRASSTLIWEVQIPMAKLLELNQVSAGYGDLQVLFDVSLHVEEGECVGLVGSNGAGKSTLLSVISGFRPITSGSMLWMGEDLAKVPTTKKVDLGIAHIPQDKGIFRTMSVIDNLTIAGYSSRVKKNREKNIERMLKMFPKLDERQNQIAGSLSGGEQQMLVLCRALMLAIARSLVMEPKLLILDEPSLGLAPIIVKDVFEIIRRIRNEGVSILIVEQNLYSALGLAQRGYVMETGHIALEGTSQELLNNEAVKKAYLGI